MAKKEFKVGEVFQCGMVKLRVENDDLGSCDGCYLDELDCYGQLSNLVGTCHYSDREDKQDVIFVKAEE